MSVLLEIQKQLEVAEQRVRKMERALSEHPDLPSIAANLDSAVRVQQKLRSQFAEVAADMGLEVCTYRVFEDRSIPKTAAAFDSIAGFQRLISVVYGAMKYGIKARAVISEQVEKESALSFGYAFAGSIGVVLTARKDMPLLGDSDISTAVDTVFAMTKASTPSDILTYAGKIGSGPINALYNWANQNASNGLGAEIEWQTNRDRRRKLFVQHQQLAKLGNTIESTSSEDVDEQEFDGTLTMAYVTKNTFSFRRPGASERRGTVEPGIIDEGHSASVPGAYRFRVRVTSTMRYSTGEVTKRYHLLKLRPSRGKSNEAKAQS